MLKHDFFRESVLDDVEGAGYAVGFYFWERLAREHGRDLPKRFVQSLLNAKPQDPNFKGHLAILENLTGKLN